MTIIKTDLGESQDMDLVKGSCYEDVVSSLTSL